MGGINVRARDIVLCWYVVVYTCHFVTAAKESPVASVTDGSNTCIRSVSISAGAQHLVTSESSQQANATSIFFDVRACRDVHIILYAVKYDVIPLADVIDVSIGANKNTELAIQDCPGSDHRLSQRCDVMNQTKQSLLDCTEFQKFSIHWADGIEVRSELNGTWETVLTHTAQWGHQIQLTILAVNEGNTTTEWKIEEACQNDVPVTCPTEGGCTAEPVDYSSMVSRGYLTGAVIAALLFGILFGALCVVGTSKIINYIRTEKLGPKERKKETAQTEDELATLVGVQTGSPANNPPGTPRSGIEVPKRDLTLPGDNPPTQPQPPKRAPGNAYTPYHQMGGAQADKPAATDDSVIGASADVTNPDDARKTSVSGRAASPLPDLPVEAAREGAGSSSEPEEMYVNADAHVYEGVRHEAPIYENRDMGVYESLNKGKNK